jgi:hypothetical protein
MLSQRPFIRDLPLPPADLGDLTDPDDPQLGDPKQGKGPTSRSSRAASKESSRAAASKGSKEAEAGKRKAVKKKGSTSKRGRGGSAHGPIRQSSNPFIAACVRELENANPGTYVGCSHVTDWSDD